MDQNDLLRFSSRGNSRKRSRLDAFGIQDRGSDSGTQASLASVSTELSQRSHYVPLQEDRGGYRGRERDDYSVSVGTGVLEDDEEFDEDEQVLAAAAAANAARRNQQFSGEQLGVRAPRPPPDRQQRAQFGGGGGGGGGADSDSEEEYVMVNPLDSLIYHCEQEQKQQQNEEGGSVSGGSLSSSSAESHSSAAAALIDDGNWCLLCHMARSPEDMNNNPLLAGFLRMHRESFSTTDSLTLYVQMYDVYQRQLRRTLPQRFRERTWSMRSMIDHFLFHDPSPAVITSNTLRLYGMLIHELSSKLVMRKKNNPTKRRLNTHNVRMFMSLAKGLQAQSVILAKLSSSKR